MADRTEDSDSKIGQENTVAKPKATSSASTIEDHDANASNDAAKSTSDTLAPPDTGQTASGKTDDDSDDDDEDTAEFKSSRNSVSITPTPQNGSRPTTSALDGASSTDGDNAQGAKVESTSAPAEQPNGHATEPLKEELPEPEVESTSSRPTSSHTVPTDVTEPASPPKKRLIKSPFSFFSRNSSGADKTSKATTSQGSNRRGTVSSIFTSDSTGAQSKQEETPAQAQKKGDRNSLKDRFKLLRMQEEAGIKWTDDNDEDGERPSSSSSKTDVNAMLPGRETEDASTGRMRTGSTSVAPFSAPKPPTLNENLPPGTAAGTSTGPPPEQDQNVDWDLWQAVVYEGPGAVARTSATELREAIANGIPSAIRGVVWQVLAQSQSAELEIIYNDLVNRRAEAKSRTTSELKPRPQSMKSPDTTSAAETPIKEAVTSSGSSMHSALSSPSSPNPEVVASPATSQDANSIEAHAKAHALLEAEEKKRKKEEAAALTKLERSIKRDLGARTSYSKFLASAGLQSGLFGICKAYALYDEEVGYAQGMNFIAMPLLFNMPEEEAFCLFVRLMNQYHLRDMFVAEMPGLHLHLYQFSRLLEDLCPALFCHLNRRGVHPQLYATQWFLTLFAYRFPLQLVLRIYDLILSEGLESAILKFGITLMQKNAESLLAMKDMAVLTTYLKERLFDAYIDRAPSASSVLESGFFGSAGGIDKEVYHADALVRDACAIDVTPELLKQYTAEWETQTRESKQKAAEEESLRAANSALSLQVRNLEARSQKHDAEHVHLASELVRTKVTNQELTDANESLTTRVTELQEIITRQPGETEERLREEMERIIARNSEVQGQNRALEEALAEMEGELVNSKVARAGLQEELSELRGKWSSVSALMSGKGSPRIG